VRVEFLQKRLQAAAIDFGSPHDCRIALGAAEIKVIVIPQRHLFERLWLGNKRRIAARLPV
jgi:hypothetical protein